MASLADSGRAIPVPTGGPSPDRPTISVKGLTMQYGALRAVNALNFEVQSGEIFALLGPSGAGKTTTIEILEGHRRRTRGDVQVLGMDPERAGRRFRERIGIMLQSGGIDAEMTVTETLRLYASFYRRPRPVPETLALVGLAEHARVRVATLSGGMERRLDLALALIGNPEVVFLDEPTTGFDPNARRAAWQMVAGLRELGKTVLLASHYMDEVEQLADRVAIMRHGSIVAASTPRKLGGRDVAEAVISFRLPYPGWGDDLPRGPWKTPQRRDDLLVLHTEEATRALSILTPWAAERGEELVGLTVTRPSLEDAYLQITQQPDAASP